MPPKKNTSTDEAGASAPPSHGYSEGEIQLLVAIIKQLPRPTYDADKIAEEIGSASGSSVRKRVSNAIAKHGWFGGSASAAGDDEAGTPGTTPAKKPRGKRTPKKKAPSDEEEGDAQEQETPSKKKPRVSKAKAKAKVEEDVDDEAVQLEEPVKQEAGDGAAEAEI
ncbi:hypothetical protein CGCVW01_v005627 [Colletotrichum viniferum]|nr:hypothetical protein CGCVW01_v005627 [Colletotrichum viniferum]